MRDGDNLVLPKVGGSPGSIAGLITLMKDAGYRVDLVEVVTPAAVALDRMMGRGRSTGRYIPPDVMAEGIDGAPRTYQLLKEKGIADGYARIDNAPGRGEPRGILEDDGDILHAFGRGAGGDRVAPARDPAEGVEERRLDPAFGEEPDGRLAAPAAAAAPAAGVRTEPYTYAMLPKAWIGAARAGKRVGCPAAADVERAS